MRVPVTAKLSPLESFARGDNQGNLWIPIRNLGPVGEAVAQSATLYEASRDSKGDVPEIAARTASAYVEHVKDETWLDSASDVLDIIGDITKANDRSRRMW